ncbi:uncharacterized protein CLUP02_13121 [Colletotrichum lupini]|uniref:Uncharacterized protein n=1 Tax=Colletotrichum lupini TaxID=145971 RepID=A0A9Q8T2B4_9PEZI|nr:uncharacterized protein CLUP02_13121 [Colletotrichum lupini]UQC87603.1 hypothetical protein CLUP02_13121 [Colletotrichum lupini]
MKSYIVLRLIPLALAAPPVVDPFLEVCGVSVTLSMVTNTLLLPPQTISLCENSNCAIPPITAGEGFSPASTQHYEVPNTQLPQETVSQVPGGSSPAGQPAATQPGGSPPSAQPPASNAPGRLSSAANPAGGSGGNAPAATASSSGKTPAVTTSSASRSFGAQWDELLVIGVIGCVVLASLGLGL